MQTRGSKLFPPHSTIPFFAFFSQLTIPFANAQRVAPSIHKILQISSAFLLLSGNAKTPTRGHNRCLPVDRRWHSGRYISHKRSHLARIIYFASILIPVLSFLAAVAGTFILLGRNWARWLALVWVASHVAISFFDSWQEVTMHAVIFLLIAYILLYPAAGAYFRQPAVR